MDPSLLFLSIRSMDFKQQFKVTRSEDGKWTVTGLGGIYLEADSITEAVDRLATMLALLPEEVIRRGSIEG